MPEIDGNRYPRADLLRRVGRLDQVAGVRFVTLSDGAERGVRVLEFRTGSGFEFEVLIDRAFDIGRCTHRGRSLAWHSPTGWVSPWLYDPDELGFLRGFGGGLLTTCGLDHVLEPTEDIAAKYHYPRKESERYGLHGRISALPARLVAYGERWHGDECVLFGEAEVVQAAVFGEQLLLRRRIEAKVGESQITINDTVINTGYNPTPHMLLYHVNIGWPVVDTGAELLSPDRTPSISRDAIPKVDHLEPPRAGVPGHVFEQDLAADVEGFVRVGVVNETLGLGAYQIFRKDQLPHHIVWRMLGEGTYLIAIEPSTNALAGRRDALARGELIELAPGEERHYELELGALSGTKEIETFRQRLRTKQTTGPVQLGPAEHQLTVSAPT